MARSTARIPCRTRGAVAVACIRRRIRALARGLGRDPVLVPALVLGHIQVPVLALALDQDRIPALAPDRVPDRILPAHPRPRRLTGTTTRGRPPRR